MQTLYVREKGKKLSSEVWGNIFLHKPNYLYLYPSPPAPPPPFPHPQTPQKSAGWPLGQHKTKKQITRKKIKRRQIFRTGVGFFEIRFAKTVIEFNCGPGGHFVLLSSWKKFCVPGKIRRKRFVQFLEIIFEWIGNGIFLSFQVLYHF